MKKNVSSCRKKDEEDEHNVVYERTILPKTFCNKPT